MADPLQTLLRLTREATTFPPSSRYHGIATAELTDVDGRTVVYVTRRFLPDPRKLSTLGTHTVAEGDRLDNIAANKFGDATAFWRIADAELALRPEELTSAPGRRLRITLPPGVGEEDGD